jgi:hypothetical protein
MPTAFVGQNGAVIRQSTPVTGDWVPTRPREAVSPKGTIWVTDEGEGSSPSGKHLYEFNEKEELVRAVGPEGSGNPGR